MALLGPEESTRAEAVEILTVSSPLNNNNNHNKLCVRSFFCQRRKEEKTTYLVSLLCRRRPVRRSDTDECEGALDIKGFLDMATTTADEDRECDTEEEATV